MALDRRTLLVAGAALGTMRAGGAIASSAQPSQAPAHAPDRPALPAEGTGASPPPRAFSLPDVDEVIALWPGDVAPGALRPITEEITERGKPGTPYPHDRFIAHTVMPRMAVFRPTRPNGAAVLISPGGAYVRIVIDKEGYETARWLAARGFTVFVLFYRLPGAGLDWATGADTPLIDAQRAIRLIRHRAAAYGVDPARVATMGFSAGGHICASLSTRFAAPLYAPIDAADAQPTRPFCAAPIYAVNAMSAPNAHAQSAHELLGPAPGAEAIRAHTPYLNIPADAPPHFLLHAEDDNAVPVANTVMMREALKARAIPTECHLFEHGGHGFGLAGGAGKPVAIWPELWLAWARSHGLVAS